MHWQTERLRVEPFRPEDWEALYPILSDPEVMRHIEPPFTPEQTRAFLREAGELVYAVRLGENLAGQLIFHPPGGGLGTGLDSVPAVLGPGPGLGADGGGHRIRPGTEHSRPGD